MVEMIKFIYNKFPFLLEDSKFELLKEKNMIDTKKDLK